MALADINVKKPRKAQIGKCSTGNPVLRILSDSNKYSTEGYAPFAHSYGFQAAKNRYSYPISEEKWLHLHSQKNILLKKAPFFVAKQLCAASKRQTTTIKLT